MSTHQLQFVLPRDLSVANLLARLQARFDLEAEAPTRSENTYMDTADRRLQRHGGIIEISQQNDGKAITWYSRSTGRPLARSAIQSIPETAEDLPPTPLRQRIEPILEAQILLPLLDVQMGRHALKLVDDERKTILRLTVERCTVQPADRRGKARKLRNRIRLLPVQGYGAALDAVADYLRRDLALTPADGDLLDEALNDGGSRQQAPVWETPQALSAGLRMDLTAKMLLRHRLEQLQTQETGVRRQTDAHHLHQFRVAVRHSRAVLAQVKHIFPEPTTRRFHDEFSWLNRVSGPARDRDVMLAQLPHYRGRLPEHLQDSLLPLQAAWNEDRARQYQLLIEALDSARYRTFLRDWSRFLDAPVPQRKPSAQNALMSAGATANRLIRRTHKKFLRRGDTITDESSAEDLHSLRKTCKKLRYLLDLFHPILDPQTGSLVKKVKALQDDLGDVHDFHVQTESLRRFVADQDNHGKIDPQLRRAIAWLVADLEQQQQNARDRFAVRLRKFSRPLMQRRFARLYRAAGS